MGNIATVVFFTSSPILLFILSPSMASWELIKYRIKKRVNEGILLLSSYFYGQKDDENPEKNLEEYLKQKAKSRVYGQAFDDELIDDAESAYHDSGDFASEEDFM